MARPKSFMLSDVVPTAGAGEPLVNTKVKEKLLLDSIAELLGETPNAWQMPGSDDERGCGTSKGCGTCSSGGCS